MSLNLDAALIDKTNKSPDPNAEYLYVLDMVWIRDTRNDLEVERAKYLAVNVRIDMHGRYVFNFKHKGSVEYTCTYGWAFVLNTPENIILFEESERLRILAEDAKRNHKAARRLVSSLAS